MTPVVTARRGDGAGVMLAAACALAAAALVGFVAGFMACAWSST